MRSFLTILAPVLAIACSACPKKPSTPADRGQAAEALARCLTDKGVKLYGASWCGPCHEQKGLFGPAAAAHLPYVECADADPDSPGNGGGCFTAGGGYCYPRWVFPDGTEECGVVPLPRLAERAGCTYPLSE